MYTDFNFKNTAFGIIGILPVVLGYYLQWTNDYTYPQGMSYLMFIGPFIFIFAILLSFLYNVSGALNWGSKHPILWLLVVVSLMSLMYCSYETYNMYIVIENFQITGKVDVGFSNKHFAKFTLLFMLSSLNTIFHFNICKSLGLNVK